MDHRELIREPAAEMLGTMILTLFGTAGNCQVVLSANTGVASSPKGDWVAQAFGWACGPCRFCSFTVPLIRNVDTGISLGMWVAGSTTKGHLNPVVRFRFWPSLFFSLEHTYRLLYAVPSFGASHGARFQDMYLGSSLALGLGRSLSLVTTSMP
jgi:glycerol uptake facilitator-like aquaporin